MITPEAALLCLELKSIAFGYRVLHLISTVKSIRVLEASPAGDRFLLLATGPSDQLEKAEQDARAQEPDADQWLDRELIPNCDRSVIEALYHLPQIEAGETLLVVECASVSALVATAQSLVHHHQIEVIELKIKRSGGGGYGFFTGSAKQCGPAAEEARTKLKRAMRDGRIEVIEEMNDQFRQFFNLSGKSS